MKSVPGENALLHAQSHSDNAEWNFLKGLKVKGRVRRHRPSHVWCSSRGSDSKSPALTRTTFWPAACASISAIFLVASMVNARSNCKPVVLALRPEYCQNSDCCPARQLRPWYRRKRVVSG